MNAKRIFTLFFLFTVILTAETLLLCNLWTNKYFSGVLVNAPKKSAEEQKSETLTSLPEKAPDREELETKIRFLIKEDTERLSIYLLRPTKETEPLLFGSKPMRPASMIKLFVLAKAMQDVKDGKISLEDTVILRERDMVGGAGTLVEYEEGTKVPISKLMELMITKSDNTATNILIDHVGGMNSINAYIKGQGYGDTILQHKMMLYNRGRSNRSSARDIGVLLTKIYHRECVGEPYDELMINFLMRQEDRECFPEALPSWHIAHKTGEVSGIYDDGGIFYGKGGDFILVILTEKYRGRGIAIDLMQDIAECVAKTIS